MIWFFEKTFFFLLARLTTTTTKKTQKSIPQKYRGSLGVIMKNHKLTKNLEERNKFLNTYGLEKLNDDIKNLKRSIMSDDIESVIKSLPKRSIRPNGFTAEFYHTFKELMPSLFKLHQKLKGRDPLKTQFVKPTLLFIKIRQRHNNNSDNNQKTLQIYILGNVTCKISQQNVSKLNSHYIKKIIHHDQVGFIPGVQGLLNICKSANVIHHTTE